VFLNKQVLKFVTFFYKDKLAVSLQYIGVIVKTMSVQHEGAVQTLEAMIRVGELTSAAIHIWVSQKHLQVHTDSG